MSTTTTLSSEYRHLLSLRYLEPLRSRGKSRHPQRRRRPPSAQRRSVTVGAKSNSSGGVPASRLPFLRRQERNRVDLPVPAWAARRRRIRKQGRISKRRDDNGRRSGISSRNLAHRESARSTAAAAGGDRPLGPDDRKDVVLFMKRSFRRKGRVFFFHHLFFAARASVRSHQHDDRQHRS